MSENEMVPHCQLLNTESLITDYYMKAKTIERNTFVDISFPHSSSFWIQLRKERSLDFHKSNFLSEPCLVDGFDEKCYENPAVYIIPIAECMLKKIKQVFCRPCRTFVIESMILQHCSTTKHAECFFNECFEFSVFTHLTSSICCSYVSPYIAETSSCTISQFFEKLSKQFCVSNKPFA